MRKVVVLALVLAAACSNPRDQKVPTDPGTWESNENFTKTIKELPPEDARLLAAWMMRIGVQQALGGQGLPDRTIQQAIDEQKSFEVEQAAKQAKQERLAAEVKRQREEAIAKMNAVLTVALTQLRFYKADWRRDIVSDGFEIKFALQNQSKKDLAGVKGAVTLLDMFDDPIKTVNLSVDSAIPAGKVIEWGGTMDFNQFRDEDVKLKNTPLEKIKTVWTPELFLFADGSRLEVPR